MKAAMYYRHWDKGDDVSFVTTKATLDARDGLGGTGTVRGRVVDVSLYATDLYCIRLEGKSKGEHFVNGATIIVGMEKG